MSPRFITHFTSIFLISKLEEIKEGSVLLVLLRITSFSGHLRNERPGRENGKYCKHSNTSRIKIVRQYLPSQFGGINQAFNVLVSTAIKSLLISKCLFTVSPYKTSMVGHCYKEQSNSLKQGTDMIYVWESVIPAFDGRDK